MDIVVEEAVTREKLGNKVEQELKNATERFGFLIDEVNTRYRSPDSSLKTKEQTDSYVAHNEQVLRFCIELGIQKNLPEVDLRMLEVAAIWHDATKASKSPIPNLVLVNHGRVAADEIAQRLTTESKSKNKAEAKILTAIFGQDFNNNNINAALTHIPIAIESHMGPHPGFMSRMLEKVNKELSVREKITHPKPNSTISHILHAADMTSLLSKSGAQKIVAIHKADKFFHDKDIETKKLYASLGLNLSLGELALMSAFRSGQEALDSVRDASLKDWMKSILDETKNSTFFYDNEAVSGPALVQKLRQIEAKFLGKTIDQVRSDIRQMIGKNKENGGLNALIERQVLDKYGIDLKAVSFRDWEQIAQDEGIVLDKSQS